jgi:hypothetical protein
MEDKTKFVKTMMNKICERGMALWYTVLLHSCVNHLLEGFTIITLLCQDKSRKKIHLHFFFNSKYVLNFSVITGFLFMRLKKLPFCVYRAQIRV